LCGYYSRGRKKIQPFFVAQKSGGGCPPPFLIPLP